MGNNETKIPPDQLNDLRGQTKFSRAELQTVYEKFKKDYPKGSINKAEFIKVYSKFYQTGNAVKFSEQVFRVFDLNGDGKIDFREFICSLSVTTKGTIQEKLRYAFAIYDVDGNGRITEKELKTIIRSIHTLSNALDDNNRFPDEKVEQMFQAYDMNNDGVLTLEEFIEGSEDNPFFINMLRDHLGT